MEREIKEMKERLQITEQHGNVESSDLRADIQKLKIENQQLQHQLDELTGQTQVARAEVSISNMEQRHFICVLTLSSPSLLSKSTSNGYI